MKRGRLATLMALGATALSLVGCTKATAELSVTYTDGAEQTTQKVAFEDLSCRTASILRTISSASTNSAGKEQFLAVEPTDGRDSYALALWFDGRWFVSDSKIDLEGPTVTFDALPGTVSESPDGAYPSGAGAEATLDGTITCN